MCCLLFWGIFIGGGRDLVIIPLIIVYFLFLLLEVDRESWDCELSFIRFGKLFLRTLFPSPLLPFPGTPVTCTVLDCSRLSYRPPMLGAPVSLAPHCVLHIVYCGVIRFTDLFLLGCTGVGKSRFRVVST